MTKEYTTKFYENNGGYIYAVAFENGKVVNIIDGLENGTITGTEVLSAAKVGWPYADVFDSDNWSGLTMEQAANEFELTTDCIAETKPAPENTTDGQFIDIYTRFYWHMMGYAGLELFKDVDEIQSIAYRIKEAIEWNPDDCEKLIKAADMWDEYQKAGEEVEDGGEFNMEVFMEKVAEKLGVDIG